MRVSINLHKLIHELVRVKLPPGSASSECNVMQWKTVKEITLLRNVLLENVPKSGVERTRTNREIKHANEPPRAAPKKRERLIWNECENSGQGKSYFLTSLVQFGYNM